MEFTYSGSVVYLLYDFAVDSGDSLGAFTHSTRGHSLLLLFQLSSYERESETYYKSYDKPFTPGFRSVTHTGLIHQATRCAPSLGVRLSAVVIVIYITSHYQVLFLASEKLGQLYSQLLTRIPRLLVDCLIL